MYKVFCDEYLIHSDTLDSLKLSNTKLDCELNKAGSFEFTIYPNHPRFDKLRKLKSNIVVYQDEDIIFRGRIISEEYGFINEKRVICEGELAFLLDSVQRPYDFQYGSLHTTVSNLFTLFIENHNSQVGEDRQFKIGRVTVQDDNNYIVRSASEHDNTWSALNEKLIKPLGGYVFVRHETDGIYIDYLKDFENESKQTIKFGKNFLDVKKITNAAETATAMIPLGAVINNDTKERLSIKSVNNGIDYIYDTEAVEAYGWIFTTEKWDDVTIASNLLEKAQKRMNGIIGLANSIELDAADLSYIDGVEGFRLGTYVNVFSIPHGIKSKYLVSKLSINLTNPAANKLVLGSTFSSFTEQANAATKDTMAIKQQIEEITNTVKSIAGELSMRETANLINGWVNYSSEYEAAGYWKDAQGNVHISGLIKNGAMAANTVIFTLIDGYRPKLALRASVTSGSSICAIDVLPNGDVKIVSGASTEWLSLSGISFRIN